jgi:hypothetical protein
MLDLKLQTDEGVQTVEAKPCARYLGVWLDTQLSGKAHLEHVTSRATKCDYSNQNPHAFLRCERGSSYRRASS